MYVSSYVSAHCFIGVLILYCYLCVLMQATDTENALQATVNSERLQTSFLAVKMRQLLYLCMLFCHFISVFVCPLTIPFFVHSMLQSESAQFRR